MNAKKLKTLGICLIIAFCIWMLYQKEHMDIQEKERRQKMIWEYQQKMYIESHQEINMLLDSISSRDS